MGALAPKSVTTAGSDTAGATGTLLGRSTRDSSSFESAHARDGIEYRTPDEPAVDDTRNPWQRQAGLGNVGSENHAPWQARIVGERSLLLFGRELAEQRQNLDPAVTAFSRADEHVLHPSDLSGTW